MPTPLSARREFLRLLAACPLLAAPQDPLSGPINALDFEPLARQALPPAHWGYLATGVDDDLTLRMNREAMTHYQLRARRLAGVAVPDLSLEVFGATWTMPLYLSAVSSQRAFHPEGELGSARAARSRKIAQMLSTRTSTSVEDVAAELGTPPWYQLYMPVSWNETEKMVRRVEAAGCPVIAWTVDTVGGRNTETALRLARTDTRDCLSCHVTHPLTGSGPKNNQSLPMFAGLSGQMNPPGADWTYLDRLRKLTRLKLVLKGIDTPEDARLAREHGADGVVVSNHGGRATETGRATIDILPEVVDAVGAAFPVFVDGGFRRGSDILKALALGAKAVGIGRPYIWGLAAFGQPGVEKVLDILRTELALIMRQCGIPSVGAATRAAVLRNGTRM